ncbi:MAG: type II toxin-antitoxin system VapC family toxin [Alphaproteobacteria bacterium]|nr:type II toxin-antitoxin system VapC family toxin [Alphaproteobacteria bacterium]
MAFVVDASVMLAQPLGQANRIATFARARLGNEAAVAPGLWWFEVRNVLIVNERRGIISEADTVRVLREWAQLDIAIDNVADEAGITTLARRHRLTVYDAAYLELAARRRLDLATLDASLAAAARLEGIRLVGDDTRSG